MPNTSEGDRIESRIADAYVAASAGIARAAKSPKTAAKPEQASVPLMSLNDILNAINTEYTGAFIDEVTFYTDKDGCEAYMEFADATLRLKAVSAFHGGDPIHFQDVTAMAKEGLYLRRAVIDKQFYVLMTDEGLTDEIVLMAAGADMIVVGEK